MKQHFDLSLILPAYNEQKIIKSTLQELAGFVSSHKKELGSCEVVVVAAGDDKTAEIAKEFSSRFAAMQIISPGQRVGKGRDVRLGMQAARGKIQIFMDADLSTPLGNILEMVKRLNGPADVAIGVRRLSSIHKSWLRRILSVASNLLIRAVLFPSIGDTQCGFKGFKAAAAARLFAKQNVQGWGFDLEILQYAKEFGYAVEQIPIKDWKERRQEDFRGDRLGLAALTSLRDLAAVRLAAWGRSLVRHWLAIAVLAAAASFGLSLWVGLMQSVWFDEAYSIMLIQQTWGDLLSLTAVDAHPPAYYLLLKAWSALFGTGETALRSFSAVCLGLSVGLAIALAKRLFGARIAVAAAPFVAFAPYLLRFGFEIRMYAMAGLICLFATYVMVAALQTQDKKRRFWLWMAYAALVALGMYTLYYTAFIWIAHLVWLLYMWKRQEKPRPKLWKQPMLGAYAASVVFYIPWIPFLFDQLTHSALSGVSQRVTFEQLISVASFGLIFKPHWELDPWKSLFVVTAIILVAYLIVQILRAYGELVRPWMVLLLIYFLLPVGIMTLASLPPLPAMFLERYTSHFIIAGYLLVAVSIALAVKARVRLAKTIGVFMAALMVFGCINLASTGNFTYERLMYPQAKQVAQKIGDCTPGSAVLAGDPLIYFELHYYLPNCDIYFFNGKEPVGNRGGYAILHGSSYQYFEGRMIPASIIYYVYTSPELPVPLPGAYRQTAHTSLQKFQLATFRE